MKLGQLVSLLYRTINQHGSLVISEDSGYVIKLYHNGQFVLSDHPRQWRNPRRHERCNCYLLPTTDSVEFADRLLELVP